MEHTVDTIANLYAVYVMKILEKYQYQGLMQSGTKADLFTCLNVPTGHTTVKQVTIAVHGVTHTSTYMELLIPNIKNIDAVLDIYYTNENILEALTHQRHEHEPRTRVGDGSTIQLEGGHVAFCQDGGPM